MTFLSPGSRIGGGSNSKNITPWLMRTMRWTASQKVLAQFNFGVREVLAAARTYYVRTDGSNSNNGLSNTAAGAFLTIQKAIDTVYTLDINTQNVTIQVATGTYTGTIVLNGPFLGSGVVMILGDVTTPSNVFINVSNNIALLAQGCAQLTIKGCKIASSGSSNASLYATGGATINFDKMDFGAGDRQIQASAGGFVKCFSGSYTISAGGGVHIFCSSASVVVTEIVVVTLTGTPAFTIAFIQCGYNGTAFIDGNTYTGAATGSRYNISANAVVYTGGAATTYPPGNAVGTTATGGQYV